MKKILLTCLTIIILIGVAIGGYLGYNHFIVSSSGISLDYLPAKEDKDDRWGIIDINTGEMVVDNEWENEPSLPTENIVKVLNKDALYEYYTVEKKPKQIGEEYKNAGYFFEGLAPVAKENSYIVFINNEGKEIISLKELEGKNVISVGNFSEGLAMFTNEEDKCGFIDKTGSVIIKSKYDYAGSFNEGLAIVANKHFNKDSTSLEYQIGFIDKSGNEVIKLDDGVFYTSIFSEGLVAYTDTKEKNEWGFKNAKNEKVIKPKKTFNKLFPFLNEHAIFVDDDKKRGLIDKEGNVIIRAKYDEITYCNNILLVKDNEDYKYLNLEEDEIIKDEFEEALPFFSKNTLVKEGKKWMIIDKSGNQVGKLDLEEISIPAYREFVDYIYNDVADFSIESDYFDETSLIKNIFNDFDSYHLDDFSANTALSDIMLKYNLSEYDISSYENTIKLDDYNEVDKKNYSADLTLSFSENLKKENRVWGYLMGYYLNSDVTMNGVIIDIILTKKNEDKMAGIVESIKKKLNDLGVSKSEVQGSGSTITVKIAFEEKSS